MSLLATISQERIFMSDNHPSYYICHNQDKIELQINHSYIIGRIRGGVNFGEDDLLSRKHAVLDWEENQPIIKDLNSTNGTRVNGRKLKTKYHLCSGDEIKVGSQTLTFVCQTEEEKAESVDLAGAHSELDEIASEPESDAVEVEPLTEDPGQEQRFDTLFIENKVNSLIENLDDSDLKSQVHDLKQMFDSKKKELKGIAFNDALTGLNNRRLFDQNIKSEIERCGRYERNLSLMLIDVDHFKSINDSRGHPFGDKVLQFIADILEYNCRKSDWVFRYGGEEFAVLLPETNAENAAIAAEKLRERVETLSKSRLKIPVTISIGISQYNQQHTADVTSLVQKADQLLYQAKEGGRNQVCGH